MCKERFCTVTFEEGEVRSAAGCLWNEEFKIGKLL